MKVTARLKNSNNEEVSYIPYKPIETIIFINENGVINLTENLEFAECETGIDSAAIITFQNEEVSFDFPLYQTFSIAPGLGIVIQKQEIKTYDDGLSAYGRFNIGTPLEWYLNLLNKLEEVRTQEEKILNNMDEVWKKLTNKDIEFINNRNKK